MAALKYRQVDSTESFNLHFFEPSQPALLVCKSHNDKDSIEEVL